MGCRKYNGLCQGFCKRKRKNFKRNGTSFITGQEVSAGIFEIMYLIGKNETMERLKSFLVINHK